MFGNSNAPSRRSSPADDTAKYSGLNGSFRMNEVFPTILRALKAYAMRYYWPTVDTGPRDQETVPPKICSPKLREVYVAFKQGIEDKDESADVL